MGVSIRDLLSSASAQFTDHFSGAISPKLRSGSVHRPASSHACQAASQFRRTFSSTPHQKSIWDEEDEEVTRPGPVKRGPWLGQRPAVPARPARSAQRTRNQAPNPRDVGSLYRMRVETREMVDNSAAIEKLFEMLPCHKPLAETFIVLKYQHVDDHLSGSSATIRGLEADCQALVSSFEKQIHAVISRTQSSVIEAERITNSYVYEFAALLKSIEERWDSVIAQLNDRISKVNTATHQYEAELNALSSTILNRTITLVSQFKDRVLQAEKITQCYITEVTELSSSILGLPRLQASVTKLEEANALIDHDFCLIAFVHTPAWTRELEASRDTISGWQNELAASAYRLLKPRVILSGQFIRQMETHFDIHFVKPHNSAQKRVARYIQPIELAKSLYAEVQSKCSVAHDHREIKILCSELSQSTALAPEDSLRFAEINGALEQNNRDCRLLSHAWRAYWRQRQSQKHASQGSHLWTLKEISKKMSSSPIHAVITDLAQGSDTVLVGNVTRFRQELSKKFERLKKGPVARRKNMPAARNPSLNVYWRQLDAIAPMHLVDVLTWRLSVDVRYLQASLKGELGSLWTWMPQQKLAESAFALAAWCSEFSAYRSELRAEIEDYIMLNWLRLHSESKLYSMREPACLAGEFEIRKPLSQCPDRFSEWTKRMAQYTQEAYLYDTATKLEPAFWERTYDVFESSRTNQFLPMELGSSTKPIKLTTRQSWKRKLKSIFGRNYTTRATCYRDSSQRTGDINPEAPSEQSLEDEVPLITATEPQKPVENVSTDGNAACAETEFVATEPTSPVFWSHSTQQSPNGQKLIVHYCRTLRASEETVQHFFGSKVIGFDMEWKSSASSWDTIQNNVSLIQIANEERIALFHVALFKPARTLKDLVPPSLQRLLESPEAVKVGVSIKADCTRLRKYLGVDAKSTFELSHLFKVVKFGKDHPKLVNKRGVNLSDQMVEHFGLPLDKNEDVRCGDWGRALTYQQVQCEQLRTSTFQGDKC